MMDTLQVLIFTPTYDNGLCPETVASIVGQQSHHWLTWELGRCNPYPGRDLRNVLAQYTYARELCLRGPYDAMLTVEHDMILPHYALRALCETPAPVVYGTYMLRHGEPVLNAWQYIGSAGLGMSLDKYPAELRQYQQAGVGRVSGCGFGCTLIRRQVLEAIPFRASTSVYHAPDMPFALDCVRLGITQLARFDVRCGHIHKGVILETENKSEGSKETVTVTALQSVNVMTEDGSKSLIEGETYEMAPDKAKELESLGYVKMASGPQASGGKAGPEATGSGGQWQDPTAPKVPRKPV
jgi:hypothetical protein